MSEEIQIPDIQAIIDDLVKKMKKLEKDNTNLQSMYESQKQYTANAEAKQKEAEDLALMWQETANSKEKQLNLSRSREPQGYDILTEYFGMILEDALQKILSPFSPTDQAIAERIVALDKEDYDSLVKFLEKQKKELIKQLDKLEETAKE